MSRHARRRWVALVRKLHGEAGGVVETRVFDTAVILTNDKALRATTLTAWPRQRWQRLRELLDTRDRP